MISVNHLIEALTFGIEKGFLDGDDLLFITGPSTTGPTPGPVDALALPRVIFNRETLAATPCQLTVMSRDHDSASLKRMLELSSDTKTYREISLLVEKQMLADAAGVSAHLQE